MKRSFLSLAGAALLTGALLVQPAAAFSADPAGWAAGSVDYLEANGIYQGLDLSQVRPKDTIGRGAFCQLLVNVIQAELTEEEAAAVPPLDPSYFPDLSQTVTQASPGGAYDMYYAAAYGLTEGATDGSGRRVADAQGLLTREQAAKMMCALVEFLEER